MLLIFQTALISVSGFISSHSSCRHKICNGTGLFSFLLKFFTHLLQADQPHVCALIFCSCVFVMYIYTLILPLQKCTDTAPYHDKIWHLNLLLLRVWLVLFTFVQDHTTFSPQINNKNLNYWIVCSQYIYVSW